MTSVSDFLPSVPDFRITSALKGPFIALILFQLLFFISGLAMPNSENMTPITFLYYDYPFLGAANYLLISILLGVWIGIATARYDLKIGDSGIGGLLVGFIFGFLMTSNQVFDYNRRINDLYPIDYPFPLPEMGYFDEGNLPLWIFLAITASFAAMIVTGIFKEIQIYLSIKQELYPTK